MAKDRLSGTLAVILHADVADSTALVQKDKESAHERIQDSFRRLGETIEKYQGRVLELRGDALLAEFERASEAVSAALSFQVGQANYNDRLTDDLKPMLRVGIAMGEVVIADNTVTGAGVVQAQRVEQLADRGGVCITAAIHEALSKRLPLNLENLGEQVLKGFDHPVHVYRAELRPGETIPHPVQNTRRKVSPNPRKLVVTVIVMALVIAGGSAYWFKSRILQDDVASVERMAFPLPEKPSVAVLPFTNMSNDADQEYFADGMTEDLITDISKLSGLFVIARNSVFTYKGKSVKVGQVAEELGVRYVMEGSVRRSGNQVRVNAQLIDATTGGHIWAERYDGSLDDVFSMQDKITRSIVSALAVALSGRDREVLGQLETGNSEAYDAFLRGWERYRQATPEDLAKAIGHFERAIAIDPDYVRAHSALAATYWSISLNGWWRRLDFITSEAREQSRLSLRKAMEEPSPLTLQVASERAAYLSRTADKALAEAARAIDLDPNDPASHLAMAAALIKADQSARAVESIRTAMRLDPLYPAVYLTRLGEAEFARGQYEKAATAFEEAASRNPDDEWIFVYLAATYGHLELGEKARQAVETANALRAKSGWGALTAQTPAEHRIYGPRRYYFKWFGDYKPLREGLRKAGVQDDLNWRNLVSGDASGYEVEGATTIDVETARIMHERGVPFVDVWANWHHQRIPGAHLLSIWFFDFNEAMLPTIAGKTQEIVIYSSRSTDETQTSWAVEAVARAVTWGYEKVYYLHNGLDMWKASGYPIDKETR
jgi:TolB-like protein/class 3 adenylate cyclase